MKIVKTKDYEYEVIDPITGGTWRIITTHPLSDYAVMWSIGEALLNDGVRPKKEGVVRVFFSFKVEH